MFHKYSAFFENIGSALLDLVYPPGLYCISCGKIIDCSRTYRLCNECMQSANWVTERHCCKCGKPLAENNPGGMCFSCAQFRSDGHQHFFDKGHTCAGYGAVEQAVIFAFKYGSRSDIGDTVGEILYDRMTAEYEPDELAGMYDMVVPVPIHRKKKSLRGFNHADLMAESFAKRAGLRYVPDLVIRTKATLPMKGLGPGERRSNIRGAFELRKRRLQELRGTSILIIDDIYTTGSTIDEIASMLKDPYGHAYTDIRADNTYAMAHSRHRAGDAGGDAVITTKDAGTYDRITAGAASAVVSGSAATGMDASYDFKSNALGSVGAARVDFICLAGSSDYLPSNTV